MLQKTCSIFIKFTLTVIFVLSGFANFQPAIRIIDKPAPIVSSENIEINPGLQAETDALLSLFDKMPPVPVLVKDAPILKAGANTETGVAFTECANHEKPVIVIKKAFYEKANKKQLVNILKHELTHAWLCRQRLMTGHDERFRRKFKEVGGFGN